MFDFSSANFWLQIIHIFFVFLQNKQVNLDNLMGLFFS